jgi:hypothetical protein
MYGFELGSGGSLRCVVPAFDAGADAPALATLDRYDSGTLGPPALARSPHPFALWCDQFASEPLRKPYDGRSGTLNPERESFDMRWTVTCGTLPT